MGKGSVAQVSQDIASREVFQGLFKDLGKQAMALEAILRAVCGRVDKLENWLTEVSFGMTELDLKLRNIAHNIDGTGAADDEVTGPMRWAIPPTEQVKPLAPTVSKKLGADKKGVRVTGMAAAILDRLTTTSTTATPATETEKADKVGTKKKGKDKKHNSKKAKTEIPTTPHSAVDEKEPLPPESTANNLALAKQTTVFEAVQQESSEATATKAASKPLVKAKTLVNEENAEDEISPIESLSKFETPKKSNSTDSSPSTSAREVVDPEEVNSHEQLEAMESPSPSAVGSSPSISPVISSVVASEPTEKQSVPLLFQPPSPSKMSIASTMSAAGRGVKPKDESSPSVSSLFPTVQVKRVTEPFVLNVPVAVAPTAPIVPNNGVDTAINPTESIPVQTAPTLIISDVVMPTESDTTPLPITPENPPLPTLMESVLAPELVTTPNVLAEDIGPQTHTTASPLQEQISTAEIAGSTDDPLIIHRKVSQRRASKAVPRPSFSKKHDPGTTIELSRRASGNKHDSHRSSIASPPKSPKIEAQKPPSLPATQASSTTQSAPEEALNVQTAPQQLLEPPSSVPENTTEQVDTSEDSDESASEGSSSGSSSSSGEDDDTDIDDAEAGAAVEEISKAMTALKKLKHAHMLSPEEEKQLKERAHKKWFQLKGQIKEKQKKDVTNILLKRKKNVFTVSSRIELLEEKSREIFAALKQFTNEMRDKSDRAAHEILRRRVADIEHSLQSIDARFASLPVPATEKVNDFTVEVDSLRNTMQLQLMTAQDEATARHAYLEVALSNQRTLIESMAQDVPVQLNTQAELFTEKLKQIPDYSVAIENLKRSLRRKADLKLLKELEARLLGLDAENEDCLVRCLSCRKEVLNPYNEGDARSDEQDLGGLGASQLRRVNPGPSSARIYRSNVPFSAQHMVQEPILEESSDESMFTPQVLIPQVAGLVMKEAQPQQQQQSAGDSYVSEKPPVVRAPVTRWLAPAMDTPTKRDSKPPQASPLSLMNINATRAILSPDRPISAPVVPQKKKANSAARGKSLLKSLSTQLDPPQ